MITVLVISQIVSWVLLLATVFALFAVARQVGVLHERVAPVGVLTPRGGPVVGGHAPHLVARTLDGAVLEIAGPTPSPTKRLLFFVSAQCPVCKKLIPFARSFARAEGVELIFFGDDAEPRQRALVESAGLQDYAFVNDAQAGRAFAVDKLPHAVLLAEDGTIISRGLVNSREHFESMIVAHETGVTSIQEYLRGVQAERA